MRKEDESGQLEKLLTGTKEVISETYQCPREFKEGLRLRLYEAYLNDGVKTKPFSLHHLFLNKNFLVVSSIALSTFLVVQFSGLNPLSDFFPSRQGSVVQAAEPNYMQGDISILKKGASAWVSMNPDEFFIDGDEIKTGESALLALHLNDGTVFRLAPRTHVKLLSFSNGLVEVEHISGVLYTHVSKSGEHNVKVITGKRIEASPEAIFLSYRNSNSTLPYIDTLQRSISFPGEDFTVREGNRVYLSEEGDLVSLYEYNREQKDKDDFLTWNISMDVSRGLSVGMLADTTPPNVVFHYQTGNIANGSERIPVEFKVQDESGIAWVKVNNQYVIPDSEGNYQTYVDLENNQGPLTVRVKDNAWNVTHQEILVVR